MHFTHRVNGKTMEYYIGIPSYKRADNQRTLDYLEKIGIDKTQIVMSVQSGSDYEEYAAKGISQRVDKLLYRPGDNVSDNRNTILDYFPTGTKIIMLDDDINSIKKLINNELVSIETREDFEKLIHYGFSLVARHKTAGFGLYPVCNAYFMNNKYQSRSVVIGTLFAVINTDLRFNREADTKEDYEYCCETIKRFGGFIRLDNYTCDAQHRTKGGCEKFWLNEEKNIRNAKRIVMMYPDIVKHNPRRPGEIIMNKKGTRR